jgi:hypothetical protein
MDGGPGQHVPAAGATAPLARRTRLAPAVLLVVLATLALLVTYAVLRLRAEAAAACDVEHMTFALQLAMPALAAVNVGGVTAVWAVFRRHGAAGALAALIVAVVFLASTSSLVLVWTMTPDGYPSPMEGCRDNVPSWWPDQLPGGRAWL